MDGNKFREEMATQLKGLTDIARKFGVHERFAHVSCYMVTDESANETFIGYSWSVESEEEFDLIISSALDSFMRETDADNEFFKKFGGINPN